MGEIYEIHNSNAPRDKEKHIVLFEALSELDKYPKKLENLLDRIQNGTENLKLPHDTPGESEPVEEIEYEPITLAATLKHSPERILKILEKMDSILINIHEELF